ncbi:MAG TPA: hypothetical protein VGB04_06990 [Allosphingosinicella sp.]|jgi:hypothetical protein
MPKLSFLSGRAFDTGLAGLAALSAGFVAFAMPDALFTGLVEATPLPDLTAAAQPPLGQTARLAAVGGAAFATFASVWGLMAGLGWVPARRKPQAQPEAEAEAPRLRRADAHPDAPARRPLLARDLGEPLDLEDFAEAPAEEAPFAGADDRPLPGFLIPQAPEAEPVAEAEPEWDSEPAPAEAEPAWTEAAPAWIEPEPEPELEPEPDAEWEQEAEPLPLSKLAARLPDSEEPSDQPLAQLVNRIEFGLSRKRQALSAGADLPQVEEEPVEQEKVGHRLRSAINDLQKIASSGA